jgi:hypothetical protein
MDDIYVYILSVEFAPLTTIHFITGLIPYAHYVLTISITISMLFILSYLRFTYIYITLIHTILYILHVYNIHNTY